MSLDEILRHDSAFRYMLLNRMQVDCYYYLQTSQNYKDLWANNEYKQIAYMKAIWNSFPDDGKPEWLTMEHIEELEKQMTPWLGDSPSDKLKEVGPIYVGKLVYYHDGPEQQPSQVWFGCQIVGETMGGFAFAHVEGALRPVFIKLTDERFERLWKPAFRNVTCDYKDGHLLNFRRE